MGDTAGYVVGQAPTPKYTPMPDVETRANSNTTAGVYPGVSHDTITTYKSPNTATVAWSLPDGDAKNAAYSWPDSPDQDVVDNPNAKEPQYKMTQALQAIPGYETTTVRQGKPHPKPNQAVQKNISQQFQSLPNPINKTEAKEALTLHVSQQCCYGKRVINDIDVEQVINLPIHKYKLRTFTETRETIRVFEPFKGQTVDGHNNTLTPMLWNVNNEPDAMWKKHTKACNVPKTSTIETCHGCTGRGFNKCYRCQGRGTTFCKKCKGTGKVKETGCVQCGGTGHPNCQLCRGHACIVCSVCQGHKQLHFYIKLLSKFDIIENEIWLNPTKVANKNLQKSHKIKVIETEATTVSPIANYHIGDVNTASDDMISKHAVDSTKRIVQQCHVLVALPSVEAKYDWKRKTKSFWVYGEENKVYAPDYPESCVRRCTII
ncbi:protein SSUH2 homolog [Antedon mediterranea]|uniref:protein SSUH2 homolog n=1 Tax=Antedon mediterranea TaxID=105859 RepID=UPI003AF648E6